MRSAGPPGQGRAPGRGLEGPSTAGPGQGRGPARTCGRGGSSHPRPGLRSAGRLGRLPEGSRLDGAGPARGSRRPAQWAWPAAARGPRGGKRRAPPGSRQPHRRPRDARPPEMAEEPRCGAGGGGRAPRPGRRTVGNRSKLPTSNFIEGAPGTDIPAVLSRGRRSTPANDGGLLETEFPSGLGARPLGSQRHSWPIHC